jgi:hypothetical protein
LQRRGNGLVYGCEVSGENNVLTEADLAIGHSDVCLDVAGGVGCSICGFLRITAIVVVVVTGDEERDGAQHQGEKQP